MTLIHASVLLLSFNSPILTDINSAFRFLFIAKIVRQEITTFSWPSDSGEVTILLKQAVSISSVYNFHCLFSFIFKGNNQLSRLVNSQFSSVTVFVYSIEEETFGKFESMCLNFSRHLLG